MPVSKRLRYEILRRDNHACRYCGGVAPDVKLTTDHVVPVALGGGDTPENLVAACIDCNMGKAASNPDAPLVDDVRQDAIRWMTAMRAATDLIANERRAFDDCRFAFLTTWEDSGRWAPLPTDWENSIDTFVRAGLSEGDLKYCAARAKRAKGVAARFPYFCGIAWAVVRDKQQLAVRIAEKLADQEKGGA